MSRVENLASEFIKLLGKFEQLSLLEQEDVRKKVGWPRRTRLHRVKERPHWDKQADQTVKEEPDPEEVDLILRVPEIGSEERRNELRAFLEKRGLEWNDAGEYVFFHFHPEWYESPVSLSYGEHLFVGEVLFDDVITIHVQYDRAKLIDRLKDLSPVAGMAKEAEKAHRRTLGWLVHGPGIERGESAERRKAFERVLLMSDAVYNLDPGGDNDKVEFASVREMAAFIRDIVHQRGWASIEDIERIDRQFAIEWNMVCAMGLQGCLP